MYDFGVSVLEDDSDSLSEVENVENTEEQFEKNNSSPHALGGNTPNRDTCQISIEEWGGFLVKKAEIQPPAIDYFNMLSDEVILHIFHFLPMRHLLSTSLVCTRFERLTKDESLWARIDASGRLLAEGVLGAFLSRQVIILRLAQCEIQGPIIFPHARAANENFQARLMYLDAGMVHAEPETFVVMFSKCRRLKKVNLERVTLNAEVFKMLARSTELEVLNLAMAEGIDVEGLTALLTKCRKYVILG